MQHDDQLRVHCDDLETFIKHLRNRGIRTAVVAWREEWAPASDIPGQTHGEVTFGSLRELTVLGYHKPSGSIVSLHLTGPLAERKAVREALTAAGLTVEERCRNIT